MVPFFASRFMRALIAAIVFVGIADQLSAQTQWPEFRGPHGNGTMEGVQAPIAIDESVVRWKTPIHGKGWSSPVVWDNQIWLTTASADGATMSVLCVDRVSGKIIHDKVLVENESPAYCHPVNSYASPTPAIEEGRLYVHFGSYLTACLDASTAEILWKRRDLECDHHRGPASSPILYDGKLFVAFDGVDVQYVTAFDTKTGQTVWQRDREIDYGSDNGDAKKAYSTPQVIDVAGEKQLVVPSAVATIAYDPQNGQTLWTAYHSGMNSSVRPIYHQGLLFLTNGMGSMVAVRPEGSGNVTDAHIEWSSNKGVAKKGSPLLVDGLLYMNSDDGMISCREATTGEVLWLKRAGGEYAASPIYADHRIYMFSAEGEIFTIEPGREFKLLAQTSLGDGFMASPAIAGNHLILRSKSHLYCIGETRPDEPASSE